MYMMKRLIVLKNHENNRFLLNILLIFKFTFDFSVLNLMNRVIKTDDVDFLGVELGVC
jgi:hypothetical protein